MQICVTVTQDHIRNGLQESSMFCPIALALKDEGFDDPNVDDETVEFLMDGEQFTGRLPREVEDRVINWDYYGVMEPFTLDMEVCEA